MEFIIVFLYSYLLGSIPFGLIITKIFLKKDIRKIGSGNIGATNVLRSGKKSLAALTLLFDIFKGYTCVYMTIIFNEELIYIAGLICFLGHIFSIWLKFKGGKGIATFLGIILALSFNFAIIFGIVWFLIFIFSKYSSLSSIISTFSVFIYSLFLLNQNLNYFLFTIFLIVLFTHRENLKRLKEGTERKIKL
jgi:glycerol-3-phosphate acyltransferase PlsY